jgi:hypothetical protein
MSHLLTIETRATRRLGNLHIEGGPHRDTPVTTKTLFKLLDVVSGYLLVQHKLVPVLDIHRDFLLGFMLHAFL